MRQNRQWAGQEREEKLYCHFKDRHLDCLASEVPASLRATRYELYIHLSPSLLAGGEIAGAVLMRLSHAATLDHFIYHCDCSALAVGNIYVAKDIGPGELEWQTILSERHLERLGFVRHPSRLRREGLGPDGHTVLCFFPPPEFESSDSLDDCSTSDSLSEALVESSVLFLFKATILDQAEGLYLDACTDVGEPSLQTSLEQLFARRVFPCIDLPTMKTQFISHFFVWQEDHHQVHTSTPIESSVPITLADQHMVCETLGIPPRSTARMLLQTFRPTIEMPPYSFSFLYGDFLPIKCDLTPDDFDLTLLLPTRRVRDLTEMQDSAQVVLRWAAHALAFLRTDFFRDVERSSPTLSKLLIIPLITQRGLGLENHGAITLKDDFCLASAKNAKVGRLARIARLVIHEICHQWIGNRFTPAEISDIWLKEGLTRFFEFALLGHLLMTRGDFLAAEYIASVFLYDIKLDSLLVDSMDPNSVLSPSNPNHPVQPSEKRLRRTELMTLFDSITYNKAAAVLAMWDAVFSVCLSETRVSYFEPSLSDHSDSFIPLESSVWCRALQFTLARNTTGLLYWTDMCDSADRVRDREVRTSKASPYNPILVSLIDHPSSKLPRISDRLVGQLLTPWLAEMGHPHVHWTRQSTAEDGIDIQVVQHSSQVSLAECWEAKSLRPRCNSLCRRYASLWTIPLCLEMCAEHRRTGEKVFVQDYFLMETQTMSLRLRVKDKTAWKLSRVRVVDPAGWLGYCVMSGPIESDGSSWRKSPLGDIWSAVSRGFALAVAVSCRRSLMGISIRNTFQPKTRRDESQNRLSKTEADSSHFGAGEKAVCWTCPSERCCDDEFEEQASRLAGLDTTADFIERSHAQVAGEAEKVTGRLSRAIFRYLTSLQRRTAHSDDVASADMMDELRESFTMKPRSSEDIGRLHGIESCVNPLWSIGITGGLSAAIQGRSNTLV